MKRDAGRKRRHRRGRRQISKLNAGIRLDSMQIEHHALGRVAEGDASDGTGIFVYLEEGNVGGGRSVEFTIRVVRDGRQLIVKEITEIIE